MGLQNATLHDHERSGSGPGHAFQKSSAIDAVVVIVKSKVSLLASHYLFPPVFRERIAGSFIGSQLLRLCPSSHSSLTRPRCQTAFVQRFPIVSSRSQTS